MGCFSRLRELPPVEVGLSLFEEGRNLSLMFVRLVRRPLNTRRNMLRTELDTFDSQTTVYSRTSKAYFFPPPDRGHNGNDQLRFHLIGFLIAALQNLCTIVSTVQLFALSTPLNLDSYLL